MEMAVANQAVGNVKNNHEGLMYGALHCLMMQGL
jgi:hypothetical protein